MPHILEEYLGFSEEETIKVVNAHDPIFLTGKIIAEKHGYSTFNRFILSDELRVVEGDLNSGIKVNYCDIFLPKVVAAYLEMLAI